MRDCSSCPHSVANKPELDGFPYECTQCSKCRAKDPRQFAGKYHLNIEDVPPWEIPHAIPPHATERERRMWTARPPNR